MPPTSIRIDNVEYIRADSAQPVRKAGPEVIIRTYSAGVHVGELKKREGKEVTLSNARRIWSWQGALTLNEISTAGVNRSRSKISKPVTEILLLEAIEVIPVVEGVDLSTTEK